MGSIFGIRKISTNQLLEEWLKRNIEKLVLAKLNVVHTTFHGYPAYSVEQKPESPLGQTPMNFYHVRVNPTTIYTIGYEIIPDPWVPAATLTPGNPTAADIQKILDSIVFLAD